MRDLTDVTSEREVRETMPSMNLAVAGALARAGWNPGRIAEALDLPPAFAELLCASAVRDGEPEPGGDGRLIAALARKVEQRRSQEQPSARLSHEPRRPRVASAVSPRLLFWNVGVLLLTVLGNFITDIRHTLRALLLGAAVIGLVLTTRQAARIRRTSPGPPRTRTDP